MPWRHTHLQKYSQSSFLAISKAPSHISDLGPIETADKILEWKKARRHQGLRNEKIVNEPLPVREDLDQDLVDVIHALFIKDPSLRCDVRDLVTFPWFQGWQEDAGYRFYNHMTPFGEDSPDDPGYNDRQARRKSLANRLGASHDYSDPVEDEIEDVIEYQEVSDDDPYMEDKLPPGGGAKL
ncbi:MAG: hypothetical protein M1812_002417 [Candelaria pacifica]|nr:MAG: hypothetical protein M1812_002417 [Candelaria pacifica]